MRAGKSGRRTERRPRRAGEGLREARKSVPSQNERSVRAAEGEKEREHEGVEERRAEERRQCSSKTQCSAAVIYLCEDEAIS